MKINTNSISELILKFENLEPVEKNNYSEADVGTKFVLPLLEILGWNKENGSKRNKGTKERHVWKTYGLSLMPIRNRQNCC